MNTRYSDENKERIFSNCSGSFNGRTNSFLRRSKVLAITSDDNTNFKNMENKLNYDSENEPNDTKRSSIECLKRELSDNDLIEIQTVPSSFKYDVNKNKTQQVCNQFRSKGSPLCENSNCQKAGVNETSFNCEQLNIDECLLDLDDYLEKIDSSTFKYDEFLSNKSERVYQLAENIAYPNFKRGIQLRNTISYTLKEQETYLEKCNVRETPTIYATYSKRANRNANGNQLYKESNDLTNQLNMHVDGGWQKTLSPENEVEVVQTPEAFTLTNVENDLNELHPNSIQTLSNDQIFQNLIEQNEILQSEISRDRPRQIGRRAERCLRLSTINSNVCQSFDNENNYDLRPMSAPASTNLTLSELCYQNPFTNSNASSAQLSYNTIPLSIDSLSDSGESLATSNNTAEANITNDENMQQGSASANPENVESSPKSRFNTHWPHKICRTLALTSCTLGLFNISRFACLTINYGGNFLIQFLILSVIFGIPFLWLQMCLGAKIKSGPIAMWKISPICSGIGISLLFVQYFITIYSSVVIVWLLIYIGDLLMHQSSYPWADSIRSTVPRHSSLIFNNLTESVPDYFNINVLQRLQILKISDGNSVRLHISDRLTFYLAILWGVVFLILCKGLKSFGKILLLLGFLSLAVLVVVSAKFLFIVDLGKINNIFSSSEFDDFFVNSKTWTAAAQETFLTWGLLGASTLSMSSRTYKNASKLTLRREAVLVVLLTIVGLCLSAFAGLCTIQILNHFGYIYVPGSYETSEFYSSIYSVKSLPNAKFISYPTKYIPHYSSLIGEVYRRQEDVRNVSGYQALRFVSELLPAAAAVSSENISWIWITLIFIMLLMFGLLQICVMWKPISSALGNSTSAVLLSCVTGLLLSIPFATEIGITLLHYMDILIGGAWFVPVLWAIQIFGVFLIRGRPYNGDDLVNDLKMSSSLSAFLALSWNVLLPIGFITLAVINYKLSLSSQLYYWRGKSYFSYWSRKVGALTQIAFLLLIPLVAIVQIYRYLTSGPPDILDRIQLLYRPLDSNELIFANNGNRNLMNLRSPQENNDNRMDNVTDLYEDAPPKYTPPPSYTTATGARLAKLFRQSIRHSVRRLLGGSDRPRQTLQIQTETQFDRSSAPPIYYSVRRGRNDTTNGANFTEDAIRIENQYSTDRLQGRSLSLDRKNVVQNRRQTIASPAYNFHTYSARRTRRVPNALPYTAEDVITILRSSTIDRRRNSHAIQPQRESIFRSIENLVLNAEPPDFSSATISEYLNHNNQNSSSVI